MKYQRQLLASGLAVMTLFGAACASGKPPQPPLDPVKEQITILQKQLLELQNVQNETRQRLDEQTNQMDSLSSRLKSLEEQRISQRAPSSRITPTQNTASSISPDKKKSANNTGKKKKKKKKTKPVRRQEQ